MYKINELPTPCFVIDEGKLEENLKILHQVEERTGAKILLAQKCFSCFSEYPLIGKYISGTTASGLYEAQLGKEEMGLENHVYSPAYRPQDMEELAQICDHIIFNSEKQLRTYLPVLKASGTAKAGLRINPECSTQEGHAIYDPCAPGSRMGIRACDFTDKLADLVDGHNKLATTDNCNLIRSGLIPCCKVIHNISKQASHLDSTTFSKSIIGYH